MNDDEILKYLGLEIRGQKIVFYDDDAEEHTLDFSDIREITINKAYTPIEKKAGYWMSRFLVIQKKFGMPVYGTNIEDYRDNYELEIELINNQVLSRKVRDIDIYEVEEFLKEINEILNTS